MGGPHGPSRNKTHKDQSRIAKTATLAVTIKRRGVTSRTGCEGIGVFGLGRDVLIKNNPTPTNQWLEYYRLYPLQRLSASLLNLYLKVGTIAISSISSKFVYVHHCAYDRHARRPKAKKGQNGMGEDVQPVQPVSSINLEVSVPRITLPTRREKLQHAQNRPIIQGDELEQVRILRPGTQQSATFLQRHEQPEVIAGMASPHENQKGKRRFRMFRLQGLPAQGQALLLQILRPGRSKTGNPQAQSAPTDELVFSVEFRRLSEFSGTSRSESVPVLAPGLNRVVIFLDEENIPCSYSIDGTEG